MLACAHVSVCVYVIGSLLGLTWFTVALGWQGLAGAGRGWQGMAGAGRAAGPGWGLGALSADCLAGGGVG